MYVPLTLLDGLLVWPIQQEIDLLKVSVSTVLRLDSIRQLAQYIPLLLTHVKSLPTPRLCCIFSPVYLIFAVTVFYYN